MTYYLIQPFQTTSAGVVFGAADQEWGRKLEGGYWVIINHTI